MFCNGDSKKIEVNKVRVKEGNAQVHNLNTSTLITMKAHFTSGDRRCVVQDAQS
jgi:hypothetical protein